MANPNPNQQQLIQHTSENTNGTIQDNRLSLWRNQYLGGVPQGPRFVGPPGGALYPQLPFDISMYDNNWEYTHRRLMQEIVPNVFLGPLASAGTAALENLLKAEITHVVCVRHDSEKAFIRPNHPAHFKYLIVPIADTLNESIIGHFSPVIEFMTSAIENGGKVLVHGNCGISRSCALVVAYLMNRYGATAAEAFAYCQKKRFCAHPNANFMRQLEEFEAIYRAQNSTAAYAENPDPERFSIKRKHTDDEVEGPEHKIPKSDPEMMDES